MRQIRNQQLKYHKQRRCTTVILYTNVYNIILNAKQVRDELTASENDKRDKTHAVQEGGFNVSGKSAYDVTFYVTLHQSLLPQTKYNAMLSQATADILKNILKGNVIKDIIIGIRKNDQIIDFQIQLRDNLKRFILSQLTNTWRIRF